MQLKTRLKQGLWNILVVFFLIPITLTCFSTQKSWADDTALSMTASQIASQKPKLALARVYKPQQDLSGYWVSEKLDGVRAYWNGKQLLSRNGNQYYAPDWFIRNFPQQALDGELWIARGQFEQLLGTVRKLEPIDAEWKQVKYMVFDLPGSKNTFSTRIQEMAFLLETVDNAHIHLVKQIPAESHAQLMQQLDAIIADNGEGLMLHKGNALYRSGRTSDLLKVKRYQDAEAIVIAHLPGKGKYSGKLGALLVRTKAGKEFRLGSGFSDYERENPPSIGANVTYRYLGKTKNDVPKFASFLRIRSN